MKITAIPFTEAKSNLSKYGRMAEKGQTTLVLKHHRPSFRIAPALSSEQSHPKTPGLARGRIHLASDFDATPMEVITAFEGVA